QKRDVLGLKRMSARLQLADEFSVLVEEGDFVLPDGDLRLHRNGSVRPLVDEKILSLVGACDEHLLRALFDEIENAHRSLPWPCGGYRPCMILRSPKGNHGKRDRKSGQGATVPLRQLWRGAQVRCHRRQTEV